VEVLFNPLSSLAQDGWYDYLTFHALHIHGKYCVTGYIEAEVYCTILYLMAETRPCPISKIHHGFSKNMDLQNECERGNWYLSFVGMVYPRNSLMLHLKCYISNFLEEFDFCINDKSIFL